MKSLKGAVAAMCMMSIATAETVSIGTASVRGAMRVDNYLVKGNATLFEGSVLETGIATADLRLERGAVVTMSSNSRGTLYRDHLVLQQGESEISGPGAFPLEAGGFHVVAKQPNSRGVVSIKAASTIEIAVLAGSFDVTGSRGVPLGSVNPSHPMTFALQPNDDASTFTGTGKITVVDGHYYLTLKVNGAKYELVGSNLGGLAGKEATITGLIDSKATPTGGALAVIDIQTKKVAGYGLSGATKVIIAGVLVATGVGLSIGVHEINNPNSPISR